MIVYQLSCGVSYGDGVSMDILQIDNLLKKMHFTTKIYAEKIDKRLPSGIAKRFTKNFCPQKSDILIYHYMMGCDLNDRLKDFKCPIIFIYHNITPPEYFKPFDLNIYMACKRGLEQLKELKNIPKYILAVSEYNKHDLIKLGFECKIDVMPTLVPFEDYNEKPNKLLIRKYESDGYENFLFVGRVVPHKRQEHVIAVFSEYCKKFNKNARLFIVGSTELRDYEICLKQYIEKNHIKNVIFAGHCSFKDILAYYQLADIFICMSEHEGLCVPLLEAMYFQIPIIAYDSSAIPETLGEGGCLIKDKAASNVAECMHKIMMDDDFKNQIIKKQDYQLLKYRKEVNKEKFILYFKKFLEFYRD